MTTASNKTGTGVVDSVHPPTCVVFRYKRKRGLRVEEPRERR